MLGLCFLIIDTIECEEIWERWLKGNENKISIIIHSKEIYIPKTNLFKQSAIYIPTIPTRWGEFSLVQATLKLFEKSIENPNITHSILLSGSCIPMKPFSFIYDKLMINKSFVSDMIDISVLKRYMISTYRLKKEFNTNIHCKKHHQWIISCNKHTRLMLKLQPLITKIYENIRFADESWFLTFLELNNLQNEIINQQTTFTNWIEKRCHPKTYLEISDIELQSIVNNPCYFFGRKFTRNTTNLLFLWTNAINSYKS